MSRVYDVNDYGVEPGDHKKNTYALRLLLNAIRDEEDITLRFTSGEYHFYGDYAEEKTLYISNHDGDEPKRLIFDLHSFRGLTLDGQGASFIFHGECLPFYLDWTIDVQLRNFSVDYARTSFSQGVVTESTPKKMKVRIDPRRFPYHVRNGILMFDGEGFSYPLNNFLEFDKDRKAPVAGNRDYYVLPSHSEFNIVAEEGPDQTVTLTIENDPRFEKVPGIGNTVCLRHNPRNNPCFYLPYSTDTLIEDVVIYTAYGMGVIAVHSENITVRRLDLRLGTDRMVTAEADATHFVACTGRIELDTCTFENQLDDASNVHGIYGKVVEAFSEDTVLLELVHHQQKGVPLFHPGDHFRLIDRQTLLPVDDVLVAEVSWLNSDLQLVQLQEPLSDDVLERIETMVAENLSYSPDVHIHDCVFRNNRARGLLISTAGQVIIEDNVFRIAGAAILMESDANYWFESGSIKDVTVRRNRFIECGDVPVWGKGVIQSSPRVLKEDPTRKFHKRLHVHNNTFERCAKPFEIQHVEVFIEENNVII